MSIFKKIYSTAVTLFTVVVIIAAAAVVIPRLFGINCYTVKSGSMEPTLHVGALVYVNSHKTTPENGEVAIYKASNGQSGTYVMHRVVAKTEEGYEFKGDANKTSDSALVKPEQIAGTYLFQIPVAGVVLAEFTRFRIVMLIILLVLLNVSVMALEKLTEEKKAGTDES